MLLNNAEIVVTEACNMRCTYCYEDKANTFMDLDTAITACNWCVDRRRTKDRPFQFDLFGGEPLLNFAAVEGIWKHYHGRNDVRMTIFSNGSVYSDKLVEIIQNKQYCLLQVSIDGGKSTQDSNRPFIGGGASYDTVMGNIKKIQAQIGYSLPLKPVICPSKVDAMVNDTIDLVENGFKLIGQSLLREDIGDEIWTEGIFSLYEARLMELSNVYERMLKDNYEVVLSLFLDPMIGMIKKVNVACWAGRTGVAIYPNGDIYPCARFKEKYDVMGNVRDRFKYDFEQTQYEIRTNKHLTCNSCALTDCCAGGCQEVQRDLMGSCSIPYPVTCRMYKITNKVAIDLFNRMRNNKLYDRLLTQGLDYV
jgi:uncharacterized protein